MRPAGRAALEAATACTTSVTRRPYCSRASLRTTAVTWRLGTPAIWTWDTPETFKSSSSSSWPNLENSSGVRSPETETAMMGWSLKFVLMTCGASTSAGKLGRARDTASRRSCMDWSVLACAVNCTVIVETPSPELEVSVSMFEMPEIWASSLFVTRDSMSSAEAPGSAAVTTPIARSTAGAFSLGMRMTE